MESQELRSLEAFLAMMTDVLQDAMSRLAGGAAAHPPAPVDFADLAVYSFRQTWPDASCGFGGIASQVLTDAQTVVVGRKDGTAVAVYIQGDFGYLVERPSQAFWAGVGARRLPGAADPRESLS